MSGETCPRCCNRNGYPVVSTISRGGRQMVFACRDCGHRWRKRNMPKGIPLKWFVYGIGFMIGIVLGIREFLKHPGALQAILSDIGILVKGVFSLIAEAVKGLF